MTTELVGHSQTHRALPAFIEVETATKCNRRCIWCPTGTILDRTDQHLMPLELLEKVLADLQDLDYRGELALHNFNEPLANPRILEEYRLANRMLPGAALTLYTNGDYMNPELLTALVDAGVTRMRITRYPHHLDPVLSEDTAALVRWAAAALGITITHPPVRQENGYMFYISHSAMTIELLSPHITAAFSDRAGTASTLTQPAFLRAAPCNATATSAAIDCGGRLRMCCNIVADWAPHAKYVVGSVSDSSFAELWGSALFNEWRPRHRAANWELSEICRSCRHRLSAQNFPPLD